ncbi:hypothetical protein JKP88DRAFT_262258 [Tribonema minus]|uniref:Uncharacterized protein n=1 Tax=Tribonema minus TaxID=303371 RepID=A0A835ZAB6_9STRA|nr:hypothetical protein JKP88DRAFT_262258 [Tribonema minus]
MTCKMSAPALLMLALLLANLVSANADRNSPFAYSLQSLAEVKQWLASDAYAAGTRSSESGEQCSQRLKQVDDLMSPPRTEASTWRAYTLCKEELQRRSDAALKLRTAEALLAYIRGKTDGNALRADGKHSDSPENRRLWRTHAPEALSLLEEVKAEKGQEPLHAFLYAEAFMYCSCSTGVVKAALKGDAFHFKSNAKPLLEQHPSFGNGVGHTFMGAFYLGAPWPVHSASKARQHFKAAQAAFPNCRRNQYYVGLEALRAGRRDEARAAFTTALATPVGSTEEGDIGDFLLSQCRLGLEQLDDDGGAKGAARSKGVKPKPRVQ